jgi:hypothetical protein
VSTVSDFFTGEFALKLHRQLHILKCGKTAYQIESLKHKSEAVQPYAGQKTVFGWRFDSQPWNIYVALRWLVDCANNIQERGLAATRGAKNCDELPVVDSKVHSSKSRNTFNAQKVGFVNIYKLDVFDAVLLDFLIGVRLKLVFISSFELFISVGCWGGFGFLDSCSGLI